MRTISTALLCLMVLVIAGCSDTPTTTTPVDLGKVTLAEFRANSVYNNWFTTGYDAFPISTNQESFNTNVSKIRAVLDSSLHRVVMVIKPSCGCQDTQREMPQVIKTLDAAGFPHENLEIYITDAAMNGIDDAKAKYKINDAPTFIVLKGETELGRYVETPTNGTADADLAIFFQKP